MNIQEKIIDTPVLIIDDEEDICFMLSNILRRKAFASDAVHSLAEASQWLMDKSPAIIFLDNNLPDGKGVEYLHELKKMLPASKVILITAYDTPADRKLAIENGADEFIGKPFSRHHIYSVVDKLLN